MEDRVAPLWFELVILVMLTIVLLGVVIALNLSWIVSAPCGLVAGWYTSAIAKWIWFDWR